MGWYAVAIIGVKCKTYKEVQALYEKLGEKRTITQIKNRKDLLRMELKPITVVDIPSDQQEFNKFFFEPHSDREAGISWCEEDLIYWTFGIMLWDHYFAETILHVEIKYIEKNLKELQKILPMAKFFIDSFHD